MSNPLFNEKRMEADRAGWASPIVGQTVTDPSLPATGTPFNDGPVTPWQKGVMTVNGTITATASLFILLLISATFGWFASEGPTLENGQETYTFPGIAMVGIVVGFVAVIVSAFKPMWAKFLGPIYALCYGFAVGAISHGYETFQNGIVIQAAGATVAVVFAMLVLYRTRIIKVTDRFRRIVIGATMGIMLLYLVSFAINIFGGDVAFLNSPSLLGIGFSLFVCGLAAMNLALDFDLIERGSKEGMPKAYEWVAALGLVVTIVWLYLELLRLLSKLQQR
ncbi:MAG: Bax inhibitor-1/YccA family protein [Ilumatobacter sp.]|jgi:uncharacterized YccA/Bax inhibitor family protein|uniref:Bax inhibitor-1/YccA family protein n=1 Tax=Ilumatobacter sp. TaxID=1967498 RepID=UPI0039191A3C